MNAVKTLESEDAYAKAVELNVLRRIGYVDYVCIRDNFNPVNFIKSYNLNKSFSERQIKFIREMYRKVEKYRYATDFFRISGDWDYLLDVMTRVADAVDTSPDNVQDTRVRLRMRITELRRGDYVSNMYFRQTKKCLPFVPDDKREVFTREIGFLENEYFSIMKGTKRD